MPSSLVGTFLVSGGAAIAFLHLPVELDGASLMVAQHSEEVRLPEWTSELLPELVFFFPPGASAASVLRSAAPAASNFLISSVMNSCRSRACFLTFCLTGRA